MPGAQPDRRASALLRFFEEARTFTLELLGELERLRLLLAKANEEKDALERREGTSTEVKSGLEAEVARLRGENEELRSTFRSLEEDNVEFAERFLKVERQNADLLNLYVAGYQLHSTLDYDAVLRSIREIVVNLVGAEKFGVYVVDGRGHLVLVAHEGMEGRESERFALGEGPVGQTAQGGRLHRPRADQHRAGEPIVCVPLKVGDELVGVLSILELLAHKGSLRAGDYKMFELLGRQAATAISCSSMFSRSERRRTTLEGFVGLLREDLRAKALGAVDFSGWPPPSPFDVAHVDPEGASGRSER